MSNSAGSRVNGNVKHSAAYARKAAAAASEDLKDDLEALRKDASKLSQLFAKIMAAKGMEGWDHAKDNVDDVTSDARVKGREAVDAMVEMRGKIASAIGKTIERRPYTAIAVAIAIGVTVGAMRKR